MNSAHSGVVRPGLDDHPTAVDVEAGLDELAVVGGGHEEGELVGLGEAGEGVDGRVAERSTTSGIG